MATTNIKVRSGNRTVVFFDGKQVGLIQSVRSSDSYGLEPVSGIGDIHVKEHVPTTATHSLSVQQLVLYTGTLRQLGIAVENGDDALKGVVFDIVQMDKGGEVLRKYTGCSFDSGSLEVSAHRVISSSCEFKALDVSGKAA
jgi:hypothetical protein